MCVAKILSRPKIWGWIYDVPPEGLTDCRSCLFIQMFVLVQEFFTNVPCDGFKACEDCTDFNISAPLGRRPRETLMNIFDFFSDYSGSMIQVVGLSCHRMSNRATDWLSGGCRRVLNYCMGVGRILFVYQVVLGVNP